MKSNVGRTTVSRNIDAKRPQAEDKRLLVLATRADVCVQSHYATRIVCTSSHRELHCDRAHRRKITYSRCRSSFYPSRYARRGFSVSLTRARGKLEGGFSSGNCLSRPAAFFLEHFARLSALSLSEKR